MSEVNASKMGEIVSLLEDNNLFYQLDYDSSKNIVQFIPDSFNKIDNSNYSFLQFKFTKDCSDQFILDTLDKIRKHVRQPFMIYLCCLELEKVTKSYKYNPANIKEYASFINNAKSIDSLGDSFDGDLWDLIEDNNSEMYNKVDDAGIIDPYDDYYQERYNKWCENTDFDKTGTTIDTLADKDDFDNHDKLLAKDFSNNNNTVKITDVKVIDKEPEQKSLSFKEPVVLFALFIMAMSVVLCVAGIFINPVQGAAGLLIDFSILGYIAHDLKKRNYKLPGLSKFKNSTKAVDERKDNINPVITELYPKPVKEISNLSNVDNCEKIIELAKKYDQFSNDDKREYTTCVKELNNALELSNNKFSYVDNNKQDELFNEILNNVNNAMDNITNNLYERNNDGLITINNFIKDKYSEKHNYLED